MYAIDSIAIQSVDEDDGYRAQKVGDGLRNSVDAYETNHVSCV